MNFIFITIFILVDKENSNYLIHRGTTITDVYAIYKETCLNLQDTTRELENSKRNFNILKQVKAYFIFN
jgi:hypothetical protein